MGDIGYDNDVVSQPEVDDQYLPETPQNTGHLPPQSPSSPHHNGFDPGQSVDGSFSSASRKSTARTEALYLHAKVKSMKLEDLRNQELAQSTFQPEFYTAKQEIPSTFEERQNQLLSRREDKVRQMLEHDESEFNGKPTLVAKSVRPSESGRRQSVHQSLHLKGMERHQRRKELGEQLHPDCTFKPHIYTSKSRANQATQSQTPVGERLYSLRKQRSEPNLSQDLDDGCTFSPQLMTKRSSSNNGTPQGTGEPVHERLFSSAAKKKEKIENLKRQKEEASMDSYTFSPKINEDSHYLTRPDSNHVPAYDRLYSIAPKGKKIDPNDVPLDRECTFQPQLNRTKSMSSKEEANRFERLYQHGVQKQTSRHGPKKESSSVRVGSSAISPSGKFMALGEDQSTPANGSMRLRSNTDIYASAVEDSNAFWKSKTEEEELKQCTFQPTLVTKRRSQTLTSTAPIS